MNSIETEAILLLSGCTLLSSADSEFEAAVAPDGSVCGPGRVRDLIAVTAFGDIGVLRHFRVGRRIEWVEGVHSVVGDAEEALSSVATVVSDRSRSVVVSGALALLEEWLPDLKTAGMSLVRSDDGVRLGTNDASCPVGAVALVAAWVGARRSSRAVGASSDVHVAAGGWGYPGFAIIPAPIRKCIESGVVEAGDLLKELGVPLNGLDASGWVEREQETPLGRATKNEIAGLLQSLPRSVLTETCATWPTLDELARWPLSRRTKNQLTRCLKDNPLLPGFPCSVADLLSVQSFGVLSACDYVVVHEALFASGEPSPLSESRATTRRGRDAKRPLGSSAAVSSQPAPASRSDGWGVAGYAIAPVPVRKALASGVVEAGILLKGLGVPLHSLDASAWLLGPPIQPMDSKTQREIATLVSSLPYDVRIETCATWPTLEQLARWPVTGRTKNSLTRHIQESPLLVGQPCSLDDLLAVRSFGASSACEFLVVYEAELGRSELDAAHDWDVDSLRELESEEWVRWVLPGDPRLGSLCGGGASLIATIRDLTSRERDQASPKDRRLAARIQTVPEDDRSRVLAPLDVRTQQVVRDIRGVSESAVRALTGCLGLLNGAKPMSLRSASYAAGLTRQQVGKFQDVLKSAFARGVGNRALEQALKLIEDSAPLESSEAMNALLSSGLVSMVLHPQALMAVAELFGVTTSLRLADKDRLFVSDDQLHSAHRALELARSAARPYGFIDLATLQVFCGQGGTENLNLVLKAIGAVPLVDDWFWCRGDDDSSHPAERVVAKVLDAAGSPVELASLVQGFKRAAAHARISGDRANLPPTSVFASFVSATPRFELSDGHIQWSGPNQSPPGTFLDGPEQLLFLVLGKRGSEPTARELFATEAAALGMTARMVNDCITYSPILESVGSGWKIRGR
jgi:hypothetical protein